MSQVEPSPPHVADDTFFNLVVNAPFGVYVIDCDFKIAHVSEGAQAAFRNVRPLIGHDFADAMRILWPEPFATEAIEHFRHCLETGDTYSHSLTSPRVDIDLIESYEWEIHRIKMPDGTFGVVCYFYESTKIREAERAIRTSEEKHAFLLTLSDRLRNLFDPVEIEEEACQLIGRHLDADRAYYVELDEVKLLAQIRRDYVSQDIPSVRGTHSSQDFEWSMNILRKGQSVVIFDAHASQEIPEAYKEVLDALQIRAYISIPLIKAGTLVGALCVTKCKPRVWTDTEIAILKEAADRIWWSEERGKAEQALWEANIRKDQFLATLAHELRNPLAPVRSAVDLMGLKDLDDDLKWSHEVIKRQIDHLTRLVDDLMDISRISRDKLELRLERITLNEALLSAFEVTEQLIKSRRHEVSMVLPDEDLVLQGDMVRLTQIFVNLLSNAAKYTEEGGRIGIIADAVEGWILVRVQDNGSGFDNDQLPKLFTMFSRGTNKVSGNPGGLGIGLPLVKRLVEMHGGEVYATSKGPGRGSEFTVRLPSSQ